MPDICIHYSTWYVNLTPASVIQYFVLAVILEIMMIWKWLENKGLLSPWQSLSSYKYPASSVHCFILLLLSSSIPFSPLLLSPSLLGEVGPEAICIHGWGKATLSLPVCFDGSEPQTLALHQSPGTQQSLGGGCGNFSGWLKQKMLPFLRPRLPEEESEHVRPSGWCESGAHQELGLHGHCEAESANQVLCWP